MSAKDLKNTLDQETREALRKASEDYYYNHVQEVHPDYEQEDVRKALEMGWQLGLMYQGHSHDD